jgi:hypothetical protein
MSSRLHVLEAEISRAEQSGTSERINSAARWLVKQSVIVVFASVVALSLADYTFKHELMASGCEETEVSLASIVDVSPFEESQISSRVTADDSMKFFQEYGVFYKADAEIARQAKSLRHNNTILKEVLMKDPVSITR